MVHIKFRKIINLVLLIVGTGIVWVINCQYPLEYLRKGVYTILIFTVTYFMFKLLLEEIIANQIEDSKTRYSLRKTISILYVVAIILAVIRIWVEDTQTLMVTYGLVAAGVAVALQDFFKNFAGGIILFMFGVYTVGDRIEINSRFGDVVDVGILYTTLLELKGWVQDDQATGGLIMVPNGVILSEPVNNYTKDNTFIWDEIKIPITYKSNWQKAVQNIIKIVKEETQDMIVQADKELYTLRRQYYLSERDVQPAVYITLTDNWILLNIRYITDARKRRRVKNAISRRILKEILPDEEITIASETVDIVGFPE
ncbi:MAG: mechanosensitive ion channel family protein [Candidatus Methanofastidiosia archaeon]